MAASRWSRPRGPTPIRPLRTVRASVATLGSLTDLLQVCELVTGLSPREPQERGQAAGKSPCKEDSRAACPAQFDTRSGPDANGRPLPAPPAPAVGRLPAEAVATAIALLASVIAKAAAPTAKRGGR